jgi:dihydroorotate dehydrogenase electron transfer subunit
MDERLPRAVTIEGVDAETPSVRSISFDTAISFVPGQFVMVWVPGVDEVPMALTSEHSIAVQQVGDATRVLCALAEGDRIGIRGPFGNGYAVRGRTLAVAGGIGAAPLLPLALQGYVDLFLLGARTAEELPFLDRLRECSRLGVATDDGSYSHHGFVTDLLEEIDVQAFDHVCVCGPEVMMRAVLRHLERESVADRGQFSLHRYMKCGIGVCGSCCIDPTGLRVCRDGPVFSGDVLIGSEFGQYSRDGSGTRRPI